MVDLDKELEACCVAEADAVPDRALTPIEGVGENLIVLGYEYGAVCKDYIYNARAKDEDILRAKAANSITELQDVTCQALIAFAKLRKLTESMKDMTIEQFIYDGLERQQYRMSEIKAKKINYK